MTQSGGDADTVGDSWAVCDDQLDICEAGGAVLATPLYWYEIIDYNVHPDAEGITLFGQTFAWAMAEVEAGRRWTISRPRACAVRRMRTRLSVCSRAVFQAAPSCRHSARAAVRLALKC